MEPTPATLPAQGTSTTIGTVIGCDDAFNLAVERDDGTAVLCDILTQGHAHAAPDYNEGDRVLLWEGLDQPGRGVVLGLIGPPPTKADAQPEMPAEVVIEARSGLTLRVGDGSITIREDGRILIKGRELVSHAKGMNRIRGGSVAIN
jgi:hypothetical protein